jgi:hypothetical protein
MIDFNASELSGARCIAGDSLPGHCDPLDDNECVASVQRNRETNENALGLCVASEFRVKRYWLCVSDAEDGLDASCVDNPLQDMRDLLGRARVERMNHPELHVRCFFRHDQRHAHYQHISCRDSEWGDDAGIVIETSQVGLQVNEKEHRRLHYDSGELRQSLAEPVESSRQCGVLVRQRAVVDSDNKVGHTG